MFNKVITLLKGYKEFFKDYIVRKSSARFMPENPLHDDLYIVSFPKSGTTWLNFLMANIHLKMSGVKQQVTFYNVEDFIPDIGEVRCLKENILAFPGHRVIKSHAEMNPAYKKIIYLVRDPRDVMVSYHWLLKKLELWQEDLSHLIHSPVYGIEAWCRHVEGWVRKTPVTNRIHFVRYEDMKSDLLNVLTRIYILLGHNIPREIIEQSIELSSFENMKKLETDYNYGGDFRFPEFGGTRNLGVRKGKTGGYRAEISEMDLNFIHEKAATWLSLFKYSEK
jgi:hypothetical protein